MKPTDLIIVQRERRQIGQCYVCGTPFFEGESQSAQRHMGRCARKNLNELRAEHSPTVKWEGTAMDPNTWDPEVAAYLKKVGDRMLAEGRLESLPNERVD